MAAAQFLGSEEIHSSECEKPGLSFLEKQHQSYFYILREESKNLILNTEGRM